MSPASIKSGIYRSGEVFTFDIFVVADLVVDVVVFVCGHEHVALHVDLLEDNLALLGLLHPQPVATSVLLYPSSEVRKSSVLYHYSQNQSVEGYIIVLQKVPSEANPKFRNHGYYRFHI